MDLLFRKEGGAASFICRGRKRVVCNEKLFDMSVSQWVVTSLDSFVVVVKIFLGTLLLWGAYSLPIAEPKICISAVYNWRQIYGSVKNLHFDSVSYGAV
jgi:hypothetical protein